MVEKSEGVGTLLRNRFPPIGLSPPEAYITRRKTCAGTGTRNTEAGDRLEGGKTVVESLLKPPFTTKTYYQVPSNGYK